MCRMWRLVSGMAIGLCLFVGPLSAQQWERLPLNVGYLDKLVQNPYNPLEIVGYVQNGDFYRSVDGGLSWKKIEQDSVPFARSYHRLTMDPLGRYYLMTHSDGLWRSSDTGMTWERLPVPGESGYSSSSRTLFGSNGEIFLWEGRTPTLYFSRDDGSTWLERGPQGLKVDLDFYLDIGSNAIMLVLTKNQIAVTTDTGMTWSEYSLPRPANSVLFAESQDTSLVFQYLSGLDVSDVIESCDTGKTWQQVSGQSIQVDQGDCMHDIFITEKLFRMNDSTVIYPICHILQRSTDSGRSFQQITDFRVEDAVQVGTDLIATVPLRGLLRSTDFGNSWTPLPSQPEMLRVNEMEFAHAHDDTMFVLIGDWDTNSRSTRILLESDDGGYRWDTLFTSRSNRMWELFIDAGRPSRYFLHTGVPDDRYGDPQNRYSILSGVAHQVVPDTVLVTTSFPRPTDIYQPQTFQCIPSERFPGWIYASRNTNSIGWSSNRGESWEWRTLPISCSMVRPCPTQGDPLRIVVAASELNPIPAFDYSGLYLTENGGQSFEWINRGVHISSWFSSSANDRIFRYRPEDSSSKDYGRTWEALRTGLDSSSRSNDGFQSHGKTLTVTNTGIYLFDNDHWRLLRDVQGNSIWDEQMEAFRNGWPMYLDYTGTFVYVMIKNRGLYRIATQPVTNVVSPPIPTTGRLTAYPNPTGSQVTIAWKGEEESPDGFVRILDVLGREAARFETPSEGKSILWDCTGPAGLPVPPGLYFVQLSVGRKVVTTNMLIIR